MITDEDISITQSLAKLAESQKHLTEMIIGSARAEAANRPAVLRAAAVDREERRKHSSNLQRNLVSLATGGQVIPSYDDDDDIAPTQNTENACRF
jgi:hypothetical protein